MNQLLRVVLVGAQGRMGRVIAGLAQADSGLTIAAEVNRCDSLEKSIDEGEVVIDFSLAEMTERTCQICAARSRPLVLGVTGQNEAQREAIETAAKNIPLVFAPNFSVGVNVLFALARTAREVLGTNFDVEIVEAHHRKKKDKPSGTAKRLAEILRQEEQEIPVHSIRAGEIVGDHEIIFAGAGERLELIHRAASRETFARGALLAAHWIVRQVPGLYDMADMLGLS